MQQLRSAMDSAISDTAEQVRRDLVQRLAGDASGYYGGVARNTGSMGTGGSGGPRFEPSARGGPPTPAGLYGATGEASSGPGGFAGDPSLQSQAGLLASFDTSAAARYRAAADTTRNRAQTFNKPADRCDPDLPRRVLPGAGQTLARQRASKDNRESPILVSFNSAAGRDRSQPAGSPPRGTPAQQR